MKIILLIIILSLLSFTNIGKAITLKFVSWILSGFWVIVFCIMLYFVRKK